MQKRTHKRARGKKAAKASAAKSLGDLTDGERELLQLALRVRTIDDLIEMARASVQKYGDTLAQAAAAKNSEEALDAGHTVEAALWFAVAWIIGESSKAGARRRLN